MVGAHRPNAPATGTACPSQQNRPPLGLCPTFPHYASPPPLAVSESGKGGGSPGGRHEPLASRGLRNGGVTNAPAAHNAGQGHGTPA